MENIISILTSLIMCVSLSGCIEQADLKPSYTPAAEMTLVEKMSIEEKVGQMLFVRYPETDSELSSLLSLKPGGIIMFKRDFDNLTRDEVIAKTDYLQSASDIPLIIGADEEGGSVVRVSSNPNLADEPYKSPRQLFSEGGMEAVVDNAHEKSQLLLSLGVNMNLAPVADVSADPDTYIYKRSFGQGYNETADFISQTVAAMREEGIYSVLKHFPGYGTVTGDSHKGEVHNSKDADAIYNEDLTVFKAGIDAGASSVLVSHNIIDNIDGENPASLSPAIHEILRNDLGFEGVIMTDDISMGAVNDMENVFIRAVNAGNDLLLTTDYETAYNQILEAVQNGSISVDRINAAVSRILKMKGLM